MYERSAIVLERFFDNLLGFNQVNNLKKNFNNYCELFEKFKVLQTSNAEEISALKDFQDAENRIEEIQIQEEKLYKKVAKLQYSRDLVFQDISQKPEEIEKCSLKLEADIQKCHDKLVVLREDFVAAVKNYNEKKSILSKCKKTRKKAESDYNNIFDETQINLENIPEEYITIAKEFSISEIQADIVDALSENGKSEKIPFNNQVITNAAQVGFDIKTKEVESYLEAYKLSQKLVNELLDGAVSMELHEKKIKNTLVKFSFLNAEKDYIIGFLDYERITVIYGKRMHRTLMIDACEKLEKDIEQVENLYKILLKEIAGKSTKKAYKELYNKSYLLEIEDKDAKFKKEKNRVNLSTGTIMNSNYWRIEGIKNIYTVFYQNVVEVFGRDLDEFKLPEEQEDLDDESVLDVAEFEEETAPKAKAQKVAEVKEQKTEEKIVKAVETPKIKVDSKAEKSKVVKEKSEKANIKKIEKQELPEEQEIEIAIEIDENSIKEKNAKQAKKSKEQEIEEIDQKIDNIFDEIDLLTENEPEIEENDLSKRKLKLAKVVKKRGRKKVRHYTRQIVTKEEDSEIIEPELDEETIETAVKLADNDEIDLKNDTEIIKDIEEDSVENFKEDDEIDIFGEKYKNIDSQLAELEELEEYKISKAQAKEIDFDDIEEESMFDSMEEDKEKLDFIEIDLDNDLKKKKSKNKIFGSFKKLNSKSKKKLANE